MTDGYEIDEVPLNIRIYFRSPLISVYKLKAGNALVIKAGNALVTPLVLQAGIP